MEDFPGEGRVAGQGLGITLGIVAMAIQSVEIHQVGDLQSELFPDLVEGDRGVLAGVFGVDLDELFKEAEDDATMYDWKDEEQRTQAVEKMGYDKFPMDPVMFTGSVPLEEFKHERAVEYEELVVSDRLRDLLVRPKSRDYHRLVRIFGLTALTLGILLIVLLLYVHFRRAAETLIVLIGTILFAPDGKTLWYLPSVFGFTLVIVVLATTFSIPLRVLPVLMTSSMMITCLPSTRCLSFSS